MTHRVLAVVFATSTILGMTASPAVAGQGGQPQGQAQPQAPAPDAPAGVRRAGRGDRLPRGRAAGECAGRRQHHQQHDHPELAGHEHRRPAAGGAGRQRHPGVGARRQRQYARRDVHAGDVAAGAGGRPVDLPRFLRHGDVGLRAEQSARDQAHRGDSRSGVGRLGRQRHERRRQRHHQDAARAGGRGRRRF